MQRPTALLADDHAMFMEGLQRILEKQCQLVGTVSDGHALLEAEFRLRPQIVVVDVSMPVMNGIEAARQLRKRGSRARVIVLSMHTDRDFATEAIRAGARAYVVKTAGGEELLTAIREVMAGRLYVAPAISHGETFAFEEAARTPEKQPDSLTSREREVLQLVAEGRSLKEISGVMSVAVRTVVFHKSNIMQKLGVRTTAELTQYAVKHKMIAV